MNNEPAPTCPVCGGTSGAHFCPGPPAVTEYTKGYTDGRESIARLWDEQRLADDLAFLAAYDAGYAEATEKHHTNYCCAICDYHVMPHRRCILR